MRSELKITRSGIFGSLGKEKQERSKKLTGSEEKDRGVRI